MSARQDDVTWLMHAKVRLALHALRGPPADAPPHARPLLLLHGLGERSPAHVAPELAAWPGAVHALDFTGHGDSDVPRGGGYTAEVLMGDADTALAHLGPLTICGRGLGAYVALLLAGARARDVHGAILCDGPGLAGGGAHPSSPHVVHADPDATGAPDAFALAELAQDLRPADYAVAYVRQADQFAPIDAPIAVCARNRPAWLAGVIDAADIGIESLEAALGRFARATPREP